MKKRFLTLCVIILTLLLMPLLFSACDNDEPTKEAIIAAYEADGYSITVIENDNYLIDWVFEAEKGDTKIEILRGNYSFINSCVSLAVITEGYEFERRGNVFASVLSGSSDGLIPFRNA